jgi:ankyrin repeat protein
MKYGILGLVGVVLALPLVAGCGGRSGGGDTVGTMDLSQLPPHEAVHVMAAEGDLKGLQEALQSNPQLANARSIRNRTLLHTAAEHGQAAVVEYLLANGMNPNEPDDQGAYPNELAAAEGHDAVAKMLSGAAASGGPGY